MFDGIAYVTAVAGSVAAAETFAARSSVPNVAEPTPALFVVTVTFELRPSTNVTFSPGTGRPAPLTNRTVAL
ncbi:vitamin K epoxide reductase [Cutibacterium avidum ATCC 25577]|uniref:Vitamin K epoxide reductase n=1 Tax=Cutibacterium avidum ATCC 25577 TaxID=997355 RepID=G4CYZ6_9ACTN|nr:vitamin K epoxide reductase [Cutibacterium avidum ATCC 25577]